jgi:hypothetical protein
MQRHLAARLLGATRHYELLERARVDNDADRQLLHHDLLRASYRIAQAREAALLCDDLTLDEFHAIAYSEDRP